MTLTDAVKNAASMSDNGVLVAKPPFAWGSEALFVEYTPDYAMPLDVKEQGFEYILDKDDLLDLIEMTRGKKMDSKSVAEFVVHYARTDAYPSWIDDIPDL